MLKITFEQMRAMKYGTSCLGAYIHIKLRFTKAMLDKMMTDAEMFPFTRDITIIMNKQGTHGHIAGVFHMNAHFDQILQRVKTRAQAKLAITKATTTLSSLGDIQLSNGNWGTNVLTSRQLQAVLAEDDDLPF